MSEQLMTRREVSFLLQVPEKTVATWASRGDGPTYVRIGRHARYRAADVERWIEEHERKARL